MKNYYEILGIEENASQEEIKKQYRKLSKEYHPDVNPQGAERFKEIAEAYEWLGDEKKRNEYNHKRNNPYGGSPFEDLFANMFGGANPFAQQQRRPQAPSKVIKVPVTPVESYIGSEKTITYIKEVQCQGCGGGGGEQQTCSGCGGQGFRIRQFGTGFMVQQMRQQCDVCGGRGYTLVHKCYFCGGKGTKSESQKIDIKLPVGIDDGQFMKLEGYGDYHNGIYGDLVLQVVMENKDGYEKMGNDLIYSLFLNYEDLKNENYKIPHPAGELSTKAPKTFDTSKPLRLKGKGYNGGDMYVKLNVRFDRD